LGTIQVQLNEIKEYYLLNRNQATNSYTVSTIAVFAGLIILVLGVVLLFLNDFKDPQLATITGVNGLLLQFIGGFFFFLYRTTHNQLNYFYNHLLRTQDTMLAIKLINDHTDPMKKSDFTDKLITHLLERSSNEIKLPEDK